MTDGTASAGCRAVCATLRPLAGAVGRLGGCPVVVSVRTRRPYAALTVDDGPHPATTPHLLDVLRRHDARATFFLIGERVERHPELVGRIAAEGHELGNHLARDEPSARLGTAEFRRQLAHVHAQLAAHAPVSFFRPGSGWFTPGMLRAAAALGYRCAMGSPLLLAAVDGEDPVGAGRVLVARVHPGAVAVLHEGTPRRAPVAVTADTFLAGLAARGLRATTLSGLCTVASEGRQRPR